MTSDDETLVRVALDLADEAGTAEDAPFGSDEAAARIAAARATTDRVD